GVWGAAQGVAFGAGGFLGTMAVDLARLVSPEPVHAYAAVFLAEAALFLVGALLALRIEHAGATLLRRAARPRRPVLQPRYR
ncbi:PucC family protein, partial [Methylobacterium sp. WL19]